MPENEAKTHHGIGEGMVNPVAPPLDYSFLDLKNAEELLNEDPRSGLELLRREEEEVLADSKPDKRPDKSSKHSAAATAAAASAEVGPKASKFRNEVRALRLNNNSFTDIKGLANVCSKLVDDYKQMSWIDVSFNHLVKIDEELCEFAELKVLYLHGNNITKLYEVEKLSKLGLRTLTLHGNPIENVPNYRLYVIATLPTLMTLDFSRITKLDRSRAASWQKIYSRKKEESPKK